MSAESYAEELVSLEAKQATLVDELMRVRWRINAAVLNMAIAEAKKGQCPVCPNKKLEEKDRLTMCCPQCDRILLVIVVHDQPHLVPQCAKCKGAVDRKGRRMCSACVAN